MMLHPAHVCPTVASKWELEQWQVHWSELKVQLKGTIQESSWLLQVYPGITGIIEFDIDAVVLRLTSGYSNQSSAQQAQNYSAMCLVCLNGQAKGVITVAVNYCTRAGLIEQGINRDISSGFSAFTGTVVILKQEKYFTVELIIFYPQVQIYTIIMLQVLCNAGILLSLVAGSGFLLFSNFQILYLACQIAGAHLTQPGVLLQVSGGRGTAVTVLIRCAVASVLFFTGELKSCL